MWTSSTKRDLIIEVWEKLDCESVGQKEIEAIQIVVAAEMGLSKMETPMRVARILADEGAVLRHHEVLKLDANQRTGSRFAPVFLNLVKTETIQQAESSLRNIENLRRKFASDNEQKGLRELRELVKQHSIKLYEISVASHVTPASRKTAAEISEWLTLWLGNPEIFSQWLDIRKRSPTFIKRFEGNIR